MNTKAITTPAEGQAMCAVTNYFISLCPFSAAGMKTVLSGTGIPFIWLNPDANNSVRKPGSFTPHDTYYIYIQRDLRGILQTLRFLKQLIEYNSSLSHLNIISPFNANWLSETLGKICGRKIIVTVLGLSFPSLMLYHIQDESKVHINTIYQRDKFNGLTDGEFSVLYDVFCLQGNVTDANAIRELHIQYYTKKNKGMRKIAASFSDMRNYVPVRYRQKEKV
ncbi:hypothetical protein NLN92_23885 [Citrobacter portucalensis]|uniref:hypothetical protein n=1 Tax=Citrobacter portucalensis TaxID=1639133 RepID=UPI00226B65F9|nr:hypothetical protein [Citrobacter portucalensis]MCX8981028.1 hypothetical protein [Citrobacter portucalensis]